MPKLLHIESSPRKEHSKSTQVAHALVREVEKSRPDIQLETLDLWSAALPPFDGSMLSAKYAVINSKSFTPEESAAWQALTDIIEHFKSADAYLFSVPMWNFGLPYILKHYIDIIVQPGLTFSYSPNDGYKGLVTGKKAIAVYARGGAYGPGTGAEDYDLQTKALGGILGFIGITDVTPVFVEPTLAAPDQVEATLAKAKDVAISALRNLI